MKRVWAELNSKQNRICLFFNYDRDLVEISRRVPGRSVVSPEDPKNEFGGVWYMQYPLDMVTARALRSVFPNMELGKGLKQWGYQAAANEHRLGSLALADTAELKHLPELAPDIYNFIKSRPYQMADVAFMAACPNPLNANEPGLGKTIEIIASVFESQTWNGPQLVLTPATSLEVVWEAELLHEEHGQDIPVIVCKDGRRERESALLEATRMYDAGEPFWLICNPQMAQVKVDHAASKKAGKEVWKPVYPQLHAIDYKNIIVDEFHLCGMGNPDTITRRGLKMLNGERRIGSSGTPIGGKTRKLWGVLNWLEPERFSSKWRWFDHWLDVSEEPTYVHGAVKEFKRVGEIKVGKAEEFYKAHSNIMVRRTAKEVRSELPDRLRIDRWVEMGKEQKRQYEKFSQNAELQIEEENMNAIGILALYTRLRQFAIAKQEIRIQPNGEAMPYPTSTSCKLDQLFSILAEHGVTGSKDSDDEGSEQIIVFSQFTKVCEMVKEQLIAKGITAEVLTGSTSQTNRKRLVDEFEARSGVQVLVMQTKTGGVAITLNQSDAIIFMDETWVPDDAEQAEGRNRQNTATIYYIRTRGTIEEYVLKTNVGKRDVNRVVLDIHRMRMAALQGSAA